MSTYSVYEMCKKTINIHTSSCNQLISKIIIIAEIPNLCYKNITENKLCLKKRRENIRMEKLLTIETGTNPETCRFSPPVLCG